jgi:hypothetical protein
MRWFASLGAVSAALTMVVAGPVVTADAAPNLVISNVTVSPGSSFSLSRNNTALATITFHLRSTNRLLPGYDDSGVTRGLPAVVDTSGGALVVPRTVATLVSGNRRNGTWQAVVPLGAALDGTHALALQTCVIRTRCNRLGPQSHDLGVTLSVTGSQVATIGAITQTPARLPAGATSGAKAHGQVTYAGTSTPAVGLEIALVRSGHEPKVVAHTDSHGRFVAPWPWSEHADGRSATLYAQVPTTNGSVVSDTLTLPMPAGQFGLVVHHPKYASAGGRYVLTGSVTPGYPARMLGTVSLQRLAHGHWRTVDTSSIHPIRRNGTTLLRGQFQLATSFAALGTATLRVVKSDAQCHAGVCQITGSTGDHFDVVTGSRNELVERQLAHFGFPVGTVDGVIDARAQQALCAWRDATGVKPTRAGVTAKTARSVLNATRQPKPHRSDGLYVDKTCQVLFQVVHGRFKRIVWASTGMPGLETPNVTGAIFRKLTGAVESTLYPGAYMFWPMFFNPARPAIALHGSISNDYVLPYPASHGCIRVWRPAIKHIYDESPIGTKVVVYGTY